MAGTKPTSNIQEPIGDPIPVQNLVMWGAFREAYDESVAVGHLHFRKRLRVNDLFRVDQLVLCKDVRGQRVDLIVSQGPR